MVNLDHLEALDLMMWLGTSQRAAALAHTDQSTISRRSRSALQAFRLGLRRGRGGWRPSGDSSLLSLERQVHQRVRFMGRQPLRLQVPLWSRRFALGDLPAGWQANPPEGGVVCDDPVALLRERVIDACLITPTQLPALSDDLSLLDLQRRPIELTLFDPAPQQAPRGRRGDSVRSKGLQLLLMPFLPSSCRRRSRDWFNTLEAADRFGPPGEGAYVAFLTPEMREVVALPWRVAPSVQPYPYVERLAVLAANATEPAVQRLQEHLCQRLVAPRP